MAGESASSDYEFSDGWFRAVADYTYDWESWHAPNGRLLWVNLAVEGATGYTPAECLAMDDYPLRMTAPEHREQIAKMLEDAKAGGSFNNLEFQSVHRNGGTRWMAASWQPMYGNQREYLGFRTSFRDVTDRYEMREQLRLYAEHLEQLVQERTVRIQQLERHRRKMEKLAALGQLAAGVAHEVNNPLAGIRNAFELIKSELTPEHAHFELLELIDREIDRISSLTHQMYQLYRRSPQAANVFEVERAVADVITLLQGVARKQQIQLKLESIGPSKPVLLAEGEVKQILYNLIRNAIQASPAGEVVTIRIERNSGDVRVAVADRGPGIAADVLPQIFDPFFTTKESEPFTDNESDSRGGMGLGLSVSRTLIEALGGSIEVDTIPGEGSTFTAVFPLAGDSPVEDLHDRTKDSQNPHRR